MVREIEHFTQLPQGGNILAVTVDAPPDGPLPARLRERFPRQHVIDMRRFRPGFRAALTRSRLREELIPLVGTLRDIPIEDTPRRVRKSLEEEELMTS